MLLSRSTHTLLDGRLPLGQKAMLHAVLRVLASLATAAAIFGIAWTVWTRNEREAARMMVDAQKGTGYLTTVVSGLAAGHGRPKGF